MTDQEYFLERFSDIYPFAHCVWRIGEASGQASFGPLQGPLLDLGCGDGTYFNIFVERVGRPLDPATGQPAPLYGLDPQAHEIEKAKRFNLYQQTFVATSSAIPLPDASVAMVFSNSVVEHILDKDGTIKEVARVLRPGGRYLFSVPSEYFESHFRFRRWLERRFGVAVAQAWMNAINRKFKHEWIQSPAQWEQDLKRHGLKLVKVRYTLSPENAATWERYLIPSYLQHVPAKKMGWVPFAGFVRTALRKRLATLTESADLANGGNIVLLAEKSAV